MITTRALLLNELDLSLKKHGDWTGYSSKQMLDAIEDEFKEVLDAYLKNDHVSKHRLSVELLQVAVCCIKMSRQVRLRNES